jgi:hypothetical protein
MLHVRVLSREIFCDCRRLSLKEQDSPIYRIREGATQEQLPPIDERLGIGEMARPQRHPASLIVADYVVEQQIVH